MDVTQLQEVIEAKQEAKQANRRPRKRTSRTVYYVTSKDGKTLHYIGRNLADAKDAAEKNGRGYNSAGSAASLPPEILALVFRENPTLADSFVAVGGKWGLSQRQTDEKREQWGTTVLKGLIQYNRLQKKKGDAGTPIKFPNGEIPDGEWFVYRSGGTTDIDITDDDLADLMSDESDEV